jgi:hypothetical protein
VQAAFDPEEHLTNPSFVIFFEETSWIDAYVESIGSRTDIGDIDPFWIA